MGFLGIGLALDHPGLDAEDKALMELLARQFAITIGHDQVRQQTKALSIVDEETGLYNDRYLFERLSEEIERSMLYQRPCSLLLLDLSDVIPTGSAPERTTEVMVRTSGILRQHIRSVDRLGRLGPAQIGVVLSEAGRRQSEEFVQRIRDKVTQGLREMEFSLDGAHPWRSAVASSPLDGGEATVLIEVARSRIGHRAGRPVSSGPVIRPQAA